jgi:hypothetical protein
VSMLGESSLSVETTGAKSTILTMPGHLASTGATRWGRK